MVKSRIFDNTQLLKEHPELPHYKEEVVCFRSEYKDRSCLLYTSDAADE